MNRGFDFLATNGFNDPPGRPPAPDEDDDANATRAGPPIKLEIVSGPDAGKKKRFKGVRMTVKGRTANSAKIAQNHAKVVSAFAAHGWSEHDKKHDNVTR